MLDLLGEAFGTWPRDLPQATPTEVFRWKHLENPFGRSIMLIAEADGAPIGFAAWLRWRMRAASERTRRYAQWTWPCIPPSSAAACSQPCWARRRASSRRGGVHAVKPQPAQPGRRAGNRRTEVRVIPLFVRLPTPMRSGIRWLGAGQPGAAAGDFEPVGQAQSAHSALHDGGDVAELLSQLTRRRLVCIPSPALGTCAGATAPWVATAPCASSTTAG